MTKGQNIYLIVIELFEEVMVSFRTDDFVFFSKNEGTSSVIVFSQLQ